MKDRHAQLRMRVLGLFLIVVSLLYLTLPVFAVRWAQLPFTGLFFDPNLVVNSAAGVVGDPPVLYPERLVAVDGVAVSQMQDVERILATREVGDTVEMTFVQPPAGSLVDPTSETVERTISVPLRPFTVTQQFNSFWRFFVVGLVTLAVGMWTFRTRPDNMAAQAFALFTVTTGWGLGGLSDAMTTHMMVRLWVFSLTSAGSLHLFLVFVFPHEIRFVRRWPILKWGTLLPAVALTIWAQLVLFSTSDPWAYAIPWRYSFILNGVVLLLSIALLAYRATRAASPLVRQQSRLIMISALIAFGPISVWFLSLLQAFPIQAALLPVVIYPLSISYIIIRYRLLNIDLVLRRAITYGLLFLIYAAIVTMLSVTIGSPLATNNTTLLVIFVLVVTVTFDTFRARVQALVDQYFFRRPVQHDELIQQYNLALTRAVTVDQIAQTLLDHARLGVPGTDYRLYLPDPQMAGYGLYGHNGHRPAAAPVAVTSPLVQVMQQEPGAIFLADERTWPAELRTHANLVQSLNMALLVPMLGERQLLGWLGVAPKVNGQRFEQTELNYLNALANQSLIALERVNLIRRLETRVEELNLLGQFSQALNFTIEFDDLLELIYTHCQRVLRVRDFSLTLCEPETGVAYTAFCVEDDERHLEREGKEQRTTDPAVLQVLATGQPLRQDHNGRSWLGAPLNAGAQTLGAIHIWADSSTLNQRHERVLGLLADRAATALDRWLTIQKLQRRAEQLQSLSEVTRLLTITQTLDPLLTEILNKAIELLDAEAGSILMTDETTGELVFRVVAGPVGRNLVGTRLPIGAGLAGTAAQSARPLLVNDVQHDRRWFGDIAASKEFVTQSSLTVPLLQDRVVLGVLQVINRRNGASFTEDDQELLMAFAGQAVVALTTARLLQQTDDVLQQRVTELSLLQQMDRDLSTTLALEPIIERALDWTLRICEGTAGALALVDEEGNLQLRAVRGYDASFSLDSVDSQTLQESLTGQVWANGEPYISNNVHAEDIYVAGAFNTLSQMSLPIHYKQQVLGALTIERDCYDAFDDEDLETASRVVVHASSAIANALLYEQVNAANNAKSEFVSMVSHELKNPMAAMRGYTDLLLAGTMGAVNEQQQSFLRTIRQSIRRMDQLIQDLTDISRIETGKLYVKLAPMAFAPVVSEAVQTTQGAFVEKNIELHLSLGADLPMVMGDQQRLVQVMTNLLSNACKYSPAGSHAYITVTTHYEQGTGRQAGLLTCEVRDTGYGIAEEDREKLFTKFFRSADENIRQSPGTGLGLSITKGIIDLHGGEIRCESEVGQGTSFIFTIPLSG